MRGPSDALGSPGPGDTCRVCREPLGPDRARCSACGAVHGEGFRCPNCGAIADMSPHPVLRQRCRICGGPRVPAEGLLERSGEEAPSLRRAGRARSASLAWRLGAITVLSFGLVGLIVSLALAAVADLGAISVITLLLVLSTPVLGAVFAWRQGNRHRAELEEALNTAWASVAAELLRRSPKELTAEQLAERMQLNPAQAESLLARLGASDRVRSRVSDEGQLLFSAGDAARVRVAVERAPTELMEPEEAESAVRGSRASSD